MLLLWIIHHMILEKLSRTSDTGWILAIASFVPGVTTPTNVAVAGTAGSNTYVYHVTAIDPETGGRKALLVQNHKDH